MNELSAETIVYLATMQRALQALQDHNYHDAIKHSYEATILLKNPLVRREMELVWGDARQRIEAEAKGDEILESGSDQGYTDLTGDDLADLTPDQSEYIDLTGDLDADTRLWIEGLKDPETEGE